MSGVHDYHDRKHVCCSSTCPTCRAPCQSGNPVTVWTSRHDVHWTMDSRFPVHGMATEQEGVQMVGHTQLNTLRRVINRVQADEGMHMSGTPMPDAQATDADTRWYRCEFCPPPCSRDHEEGGIITIGRLKQGLARQESSPPTCPDAQRHGECRLVFRDPVGVDVLASQWLWPASSAFGCVWYTQIRPCQVSISFSPDLLSENRVCSLPEMPLWSLI